MKTMRTTWLTFGLAVGLVGQSAAQDRSIEEQILLAVNPLSEDERSGAAVYGYRDGETLEVIREGTNEFVCLTDAPGTENFQVSCYHRSLEPFMARGRELRAEGKTSDEMQRIRDGEIEAGLIEMPARAMLISLFGTVDRATGRPDSVTVLRVMYLPGATASETGLSDRPSRRSPWLMLPGSPRAHLMIPGETRPFPE